MARCFPSRSILNVAEIEPRCDSSVRPIFANTWGRKLRHSIAVVLIFLGATHAASALDQRCGSPLDFLFCVNPNPSSSKANSPPSQAADGRATVVGPANQKQNGSDHPRPGASPRTAHPPLSLDYHVVNRGSKSGTDPRSASQAAKKPEGRKMSANEKEALYQEFLVWQRKQVIDDMRDQSTLR